MASRMFEFNFKIKQVFKVLIGLFSCSFVFVTLALK